MEKWRSAAGLRLNSDSLPVYLQSMESLTKEFSSLGQRFSVLLKYVMTWSSNTSTFPLNTAFVFSFKYSLLHYISVSPVMSHPQHLLRPGSSSSWTECARLGFGGVHKMPITETLRDIYDGAEKKSSGSFPILPNSQEEIPLGSRRTRRQLQEPKTAWGSCRAFWVMVLQYSFVIYTAP